MGAPQTRLHLCLNQPAQPIEQGYDDGGREAATRERPGGFETMNPSPHVMSRPAEGATR
jgi:hypothetical protein